MFVGIIDGDGYLSVNKADKNKDNITVKLVLAVEASDIRMLEYLQSVLKIGVIQHFPALNTAKYIINRTDLQEILFPLMKHHNIFFLTHTRQLQFNKAMLVLTKPITKYSELPSTIPYDTAILTNLSAVQYLELSFFKD